MALGAGLAFDVQGARSYIKGGAGLSYKYDDNIQVDPVNQILLAGWETYGRLEAGYDTERFRSSVDLKLGVERYTDTELDSPSENLEEPSPEDFDNESQDLKLELGYDLERHSFSLYGRHWRDSTLNTQFEDTGLGGGFEVAGSERRITSNLVPSWQWLLNERQTLNTTVSATVVEYDSDRFIDYDYLSASSQWSYALSERFNLSVVPSASRYENKASLSVESDTYSLEAGFNWAISERIQADVLVGGTQVDTQYGQRGFLAIDPDTGEIVFVELDDDQSNGFSGSASLVLTDEYYGFTVGLDSRLSPSGNGYLQQNNKARAMAYWRPTQRLRLDADLRYGLNDRSDDRFKSEREYSEGSVRLGYQYAKNWWISGRYQFRRQEYKQRRQGRGHSDRFVMSVSYRLPEEIL